MQNDLISRSAVKKMIHDYFINRVENGKYEVEVTEANVELQEKLNELPTAYDVKKVVEQMKETGKRVCVSVHCNNECQDCEHGVHMCSLLEIVRNGGKE